MWSLAALARPEALLLFGLTVVLAIGGRLARRQPVMTGLPLIVGLFLAGQLPYLVWRWFTFGYLFPNTYYAKTGGGLAQLRGGLDYVVALSLIHIYSRAGRGVRQQLDAWPSQFFAAGAEATTFDPWLLTRSETPYPALRAAAPVLALPHTTIAAAGPAEATRLVVSRPPEAGLTRLVLRSSAPLSGITFDGRALDLGGMQPTEYTFLVIGRADEVALDLTTTGPGTLSIDVLDRLTTDVMSVAERTGLAIRPRPAWMATAPASDTGDRALVTTTFQR